MTRKSEWILAGVVVAIAMISLGGWMAIQIRERTQVQVDAAATLLNGGFEGTFSQWPGVPEWTVPAGWVPYALEGNPPMEHDQGPLARPEFKELNRTIDANRVHSGEKAACWFTFYKVHQGGLFQRVKVTPGSFIKFSAWFQAWCSNADLPTNVSPGELYVSLGIDPDGQTDAARRGVVWTYWHGAGAKYQKITTAPVQATGDYVTVFIESWNKYRFKHNDVYVDDAALEVVDLGGVCPTPEPCPTGEPCEPCPTATPCPTAVPCNENCDLEHFRSIIREELRAITIEIK